ncbi:hypothetical protein [Arthrobacter castelli]|uniref:hypothetical protein n=1 Tax=Arthrobacter castelli TaxID=271431 RepID=UPI00047EC07F|nr:hypothetical protein [Arthrobacter castelli]
MGRRMGAWTHKPPRKGNGMALTGLVLVVGTFGFMMWVAVIGGTLTLLPLVPLLIGLPLLMVGLAKRSPD